MTLKGKLNPRKEAKETIKFPVLAKLKNSNLVFLFTSKIEGVAVVSGNYSNGSVNSNFPVGGIVFSPDGSFCITDGDWEILPKGASITITQE